MKAVLVRSRPESCLSDLALDEIVSGGRTEGTEHLEACAACRERLAAIRSERDRFLLEAPPFQPSKPARVIPLRSRAAALVALAASAALAVILVPKEDATRTKGGEALGFFVKHGDSVRKGIDGELVAPGDALRFWYSVDRPTHLAILSIDAKGEISNYHRSSKPEPAGREVLLESAALLDDTLGKEEISAFFCKDPVDLSSLEKVIRGTASGAEGCKRVRTSIEKRR
jgi:hypothetical protein